MPRSRGSTHLSAPARADLRNAAFFYEEQREGLGSEFALAIRRAMALIASAPERWPMKRGTHRYVLHRFPYTIAYRIEKGMVEIVAVAHHSRDPGSWQGR